MEIGVGEALAGNGAGPAREERQRVVLDRTGESRQQAVEGKQNFAGQLVAAEDRGVGRQIDGDLERPPLRPRPQLVGANDAVRRVAALRPAEAAGGQCAAVAQRSIKQIGILADIVAEAAQASAALRPMRRP